LLVQFQQKGNEPSTYHRHRGPRRWLLMLLHPLLKRIQKQLMSDLNLYFEIIHNLVIEVTRLGIETQNLKMRVESLSSRVEFDERRGRALEQVVQYRGDALPRQRQQDGQQRRNQNQPPPPQATPAPGTVSYGAPVPPAAPNPTPATAAPSMPAPEGGPRPNDQGQPRPDGQPRQDGQPRPDGTRRRRRRRRRRPGHSMAQGQPGNGAPGIPFTPHANSVEPPADHDDGPDEDDGAPDQ
jgi:hypothetical protein